MRNDLAHIRNRAESPWIRVLFILAILALVLAAGNAPGADVPFSTRKIICDKDGSGGLYAIAPADFDSDGDLDILAGFGIDGIVSWFENVNGDASVWSEHVVSSSIGSSQVRLSTADVDGDGHMDVVDGIYNSGKVMWWRNADGKGTSWVENVVDPSFSGANYVAGTDIDGDGDNDLVGSSIPGVIAWWENGNGIGTLWTKHVVATGFSNAQYLCARDMDGDGDWDVVGCTSESQNLTWWENIAGNGTAWIAHIIGAESARPNGMSVGDIDGDGDLDVLEGAYGAGEVCWYENTMGGGITWVRHVVDASFSGASACGIADLDNDGDSDILAVSYNADTIAWWENTSGNGTTWVKHVVDNSFDYPLDTTCAVDLDGDGDLDILGLGHVTKQIAWWENQLPKRTPNFVQSRKIADFAPGLYGVDYADFDSDGDLDVVGTFVGAGIVCWMENVDSKATAWKGHTIAAVPYSEMHICIADIDGDGDKDVAASIYNSNTIVWWANPNDKATSWTQHIVDSALSGAKWVEAADIDHDGDLDLVAHGLGGATVWYENTDRTGTTWTRHDLASGPSNAQVLRVADLDRDGDLDIIASNNTTAALSWWENVSGNGATWSLHSITESAGIVTPFFCLADMDHDGDPDILRVSDVSGMAEWLENPAGSGSGWANHSVLTGFARPSACIGTDIDQDGDMDAVVTSWNGPVVWCENVDGTGTTWQTHPIGLSIAYPITPSTPDLDGDGDPDLLLAATVDGDAVWWENSPLEDLVAYYPFSGNADDASGNGNHGTVYGASLTSGFDGSSNSAYAFDGSDYILVPDSPSLRLTGSAFTFCAWVYPTQFTGDLDRRTIFRKMEQTGSTGGYMFCLSNEGYVDFGGKFEGQDYVRRTARFGMLDLHEWSHIAVVYDGTAVVFYVNGIQVDSLPQTGNLLADTTDLTIGRLSSSYAWTNFFGSLDEIRIYSRALSSSEISKLQEGLVAYYPFSGNADDASGNGNHGVVNGATLASGFDGSSNSAYAFDGSDYILVPDSPSLRLTGSSFTFCAWVYPTQFTGDLDRRTIFRKMEQTGSTGGYMFCLSSEGYVDFGGKFEGQDYVRRTARFGMLDLHEWSHIAVVYDGAAIVFYVNGIQVDSLAQTGNLLADTTDLTIGRLSSSYAWTNFFGSLDEIRIYSRTLSSSEISGIYNPANPLPAKPSNTSPSQGATGVSLTPVLTSTAFSSSVTTATHAASQWQMRASSSPADYTTTVFDSGANTTSLTSIAIPGGTLNYLTTYCWRVRYRDSQDLWSAWSQETMFITQQVPSVGLNAWYPFEGNADDMGPFANHGTVHGASLTRGFDGGLNGAYAFDGSGYILVPDSPSLRLTGTSLTLCAWVYPTQFTGDQTRRTILRKMEQSGSTGGYMLDLSDDGFVEFLGKFEGQDLAGGRARYGALTLGEWAHVAVVYDGTALSFYVNGNMVDSLSQTGNLLADTTDLTIGRLSSSYAWAHFFGSLDEIRIYSRALSSSEISDLHEPGNLPPSKPSNTSPSDGATSVSLTPMLTLSAFLDPNPIDTHTASQWQVRQGWNWVPSDYSVTVFDSGADTTHLTSITLPVTLAYITPYKWRVRYRDSHGTWSAWSEETMFTTRIAPLAADRVVFDADGDIYLLDPARPGAVQLTTGADRDTCPRFDPTGGWIAFSSDRGGPFRIWVMRADGTDLRAISGFEQGNPISLDWSPDGNSFVAGALGSSWWRVAGDGSGATLLKEHTFTQGRHAAWSATGWIAYQISPYGNASLSSIRKMTGSGASDAELLPDAVTPAWNADGSKLLYGQGGDIRVCNADGTGKLNRTNTSGDTETAPAWSSNGEKIYYRLSPSGNPGVSHVYMANADGSGAVPLYYTNAQIGTLDAALVQVGTNEPPHQPVNQSPANDATGVSVVPTLQASAFEDPDAGDTHASSHWQVRLFCETYETAVVNDTSTVELTSYEVAPAVLVPGQKYAWRARYSDNHGNEGPWSAETVFTTFAPPPPNDRVVIVAGGGDFEGNAIVEQTKFLAGYAYRVSRARGIPESNILLLSAFPEIDADGNDTNDVDGAATRAMLLDTLSTTSAFVSGTSKLILYMVDHGSRQGNDWYFQMNPTEQVTANEVDAALDALQDANPSLKVALVVDFCYAGGFVLKCQPNLGQFRVCVSGATHESLAVFSGESAGVSFSNFFFDCLAAGHNFNSAFRVARNGILAGYFGPPNMPLVVPWLEDNWDGFISDKNDGEKAKDLYWGNTSAYGATPPRILSVTPAQTLAPGQRSLELVVELDAGHEVERVWAIITPPWAAYAEGVPVSDVIEVELSKQINGSSSRFKMAIAGEQPLSTTDTQVWKATYYGFLPYPTGSYRVSFYAEGNDGNPANSQIALPQTVIITPERGRTPAGARGAWSLYE